MRGPCDIGLMRFRGRRNAWHIKSRRVLRRHCCLKVARKMTAQQAVKMSSGALILGRNPRWGIRAIRDVIRLIVSVSWP